jgi:hypothetical protein
MSNNSSNIAGERSDLNRTGSILRSLFQPLGPVIRESLNRLAANVIVLDDNIQTIQTYIQDTQQRSDSASPAFSFLEIASTEYLAHRQLRLDEAERDGTMTSQDETAKQRLSSFLNIAEQTASWSSQGTGLTESQRIVGSRQAANAAVWLKSFDEILKRRAQEVRYKLKLD